MRREADKAEQGENKLKGKRQQNGAPPGVNMITKITKEEYLRDPCAASSLPFRKTEQMTLPGNVSVFREDEFSGADGQVEVFNHHHLAVGDVGVAEEDDGLCIRVHRDMFVQN